MNCELTTRVVLLRGYLPICYYRHGERLSGGVKVRDARSQRAQVEKSGPLQASIVMGNVQSATDDRYGPVMPDGSMSWPVSRTSSWTSSYVWARRFNVLERSREVAYRSLRRIEAKEGIGRSGSSTRRGRNGTARKVVICYIIL